MNPLNLIQSDCAPDKLVEPYIDTLIGNLRRRQSRASTELKNVTDALNALEKHPDLAEVLELISKAGR